MNDLSQFSSSIGYLVHIFRRTPVFKQCSIIVRLVKSSYCKYSTGFEYVNSVNLLSKRAHDKAQVREYQRTVPPWSMTSQRHK